MNSNPKSVAELMPVDFDACIGDQFTIDPVESSSISHKLRLTEVTRYPEVSTPDGHRENFCLLFEPVTDFNIPPSGRTVVFSHQQLGKMSLFVSPVIVSANGESKRLFEVAFS